MKRIFSCILALTMIISFSLMPINQSYALSGDIRPTSNDPGGGGSDGSRFLTTGENIAWVPNDGAVQPVSGGAYYTKVVYLSKLEAIAVAEGYRDSAFQSQLVQVLDYAQRTGSYAGGYLIGTKIVQIATQIGAPKVAAFFSGVGGAIAIGFMVDDYLNLIRYIEYNQFKSAIDRTNDGYFVRIMIGYSLIGGLYTSVRHYEPWNSYRVYGITPFAGKWTSNIRF